MKRREPKFVMKDYMHTVTPEYVRDTQEAQALNTPWGRGPTPLWRDSPEAGLRQYPNGTTFVLMDKKGCIMLCQTTGNLVSDTQWKAMEVYTGNCFYLKDKKDCMFSVVVFA